MDKVDTIILGCYAIVSSHIIVSWELQISYSQDLLPSIGLIKNQEYTFSHVELCFISLKKLSLMSIKRVIPHVNQELSLMSTKSCPSCLSRVMPHVYQELCLISTKSYAA